MLKSTEMNIRAGITGGSRDEPEPGDDDQTLSRSMAAPAAIHVQFGRIMRQVALAMKACNADPTRVVGTALRAWVSSRYEGIPQCNLRTSKALSMHRALRPLVQLLEGGDLLSGAYWLSSAYAMLSSDKYRKSLAMYFTPPALTGRLLDDLEGIGIDYGTHRFCDPACGGAAFLAPIALRMKQTLRRRGLSSRKILAHVSKHVSGVDKDSVLCELSRYFLVMVLRDEILETGEVPEFRVEQGDSFKMFSGRLNSLDVIVSNPPFRKITSAETEKYRENCGEVLHFQPNLYALFMTLSVKLLRPGGICALVTPTSFLSGQYFTSLRTFLRANAHIRAVSVLSDRGGVFLGVELETSITVLEKPKKCSSPQPKTIISVITKDGSRVELGAATLPVGSVAWPIPRVAEDADLIQRAAQLTHRLVDFGYRARIGGYVWNRDSHKSYMTIEKVPRKRLNFVVPLLWSSDVDGRTQSIKFGRAKWRAEPRYVDMAIRTHPYIVRAPSIVMQRVTSNDQPQRLVAGVVSQGFLDKHFGFVGENHTVVLERIDGDALFSPKEMARLITCASAERLFRCISGSTNVSVFELNQLPLPNPIKLRELVDRGEELQAAAERLFRGIEAREFSMDHK
jgi:adenine-specific DNA-methyltransferase